MSKKNKKSKVCKQNKPKIDIILGMGGISIMAFVFATITEALTCMALTCVAAIILPKGCLTLL